MEDVRMGRKSKTQTTQVTLTTASKLAIQRNEDRIALYVRSDGTANCWLMPEVANVGNTGLVIATGYPEFDIDIQRQGELVIQAFYGIVAAGTIVLTVCETVLQDK